jgi:hypothetical protein
VFPPVKQEVPTRSDQQEKCPSLSPLALEIGADHWVERHTGLANATSRKIK